MNKLLQHFKRMQASCSDYLQPDGGEEYGATETGEYRDKAFIADMIYYLDSPEQREAELEANNVGITYIKDALRTESAMEPLRDSMGVSYTVGNRLLHAAMGMATEAGEFLDPIKKHLFYGKPLDLTNLREELGDILWYMAIACDALGTDFETEMARNIAKLKARYPEKFDSDKAVNRDLDAEREVLEHPVSMSKCDKCGKLWPNAPAGYIHKCQCSGGMCHPI